MIVDLQKKYFKETNINNKLQNHYFDDLIKAKKIETKNILINAKYYKDLVIYFTTCNRGKSVRILRLYSHELMGEIEEHEETKY